MSPFIFFEKQTPYSKPLKRDKFHFARNAKIRTCLPSEQVRILLLRCMLTEMMRFSEAPVFPKSKPSVSGFDLEARSSGASARWVFWKQKTRRKRYEAYDELEQVTGIEPACSAWEADILPLNYTCKVILLFVNYAIIAWNTIKVKAFLNCGDRYQINPSGLAGGVDSYV